MNIDEFEKQRPGMEETLRKRRINGATQADPTLQQALVARADNLTGDPNWDYYVSVLQNRRNAYVEAADQAGTMAVQPGMAPHAREEYVVHRHAHLAAAGALDWAMAIPDIMRGKNAQTEAPNTGVRQKDQSTGAGPRSPETEDG